MERGQDSLYSIGEVAGQLGISVQTLRHYGKIGLLEPAYTNPDTGYRYYSYIQLSLIDRIRYLQNLGLSLSEIKAAFEDGHGRALLPFLEHQLREKTEELHRMEEVIDALRWYINFFRYPGQNNFNGVPYKRMIGDRYILAAESLAEERHIRNSNHPSRASLKLQQLKSDPQFKNTIFLRQNGNIIDFKSMLNQEWNPQWYFVFLKKDPGFDHPNVIHLPAGEYLCFQGHPLTNEWDTTYIRKLFEGVPESDYPTLVVAAEYEDSLSNFIDCVYEIQILIWQPDKDGAADGFLHEEPRHVIG